MKSTLIIAIVAAMVAIADVNGAVADPVPMIDWQQLEQSLSGTGDHVVGEELCAAPVQHDRAAG